MFYAGTFAADFHEMIQFLTACQNKRATTRSLAALVIAHDASELTSKSLVPYLEYWHYRSDDAVDIVFPGYVGDRSVGEFKTIVEADFSAKAFAEVIAALEKRSTWVYTGQPCVLLLSAGRHTAQEDVRLDYRRVIDFDLARALKEGVIESAPAFFESLIRICQAQGATLNQHTLSDILGGKAVSSALLSALFENLPIKGAKRAVLVADLFRLRDRERGT